MLKDERPGSRFMTWWGARMAAMQRVLGPVHETMAAATIPFSFGQDAGGCTDILFFRKHLDGVVCSTADLIGCDVQIENSIGNFEVMMCLREDGRWAHDLLSRVAYHSCVAPIEPGHTMDVARSMPPGSTIEAVLFYEYARFRVCGREAGLLLCVGLTGDELESYYRTCPVAIKLWLEAKGIYPYTLPFRPSVPGAPTDLSRQGKMIEPRRGPTIAATVTG